MTRVLPLPAEASTRRGPSPARTASRCGGLRSRSNVSTSSTRLDCTARDAAGIRSIGARPGPRPRRASRGLPGPPKGVYKVGVNPPGVRLKLVLLSLAIVVVVSFGFTVLHLALSQHWVDEDLRERAITFAREIAATIGDRRELENGPLLQSQIGQILTLRPNVLQLDILIVRPGGTVIAATSHPARRLPFSRREAERVAQGQTLSRLVPHRDERAWEVMTPIVFGDEVAGAVAALFSLQRADALAARSRAWALGLTAGAAVVMALLMSVAVRMVVERPLHRLMDAIRAVRAGTSAAAAPTASRDELGRLGEHFNEMMGRINRFSEELQGKVDEA